MDDGRPQLPAGLRGVYASDFDDAPLDQPITIRYTPEDKKTVLRPFLPGLGETTVRKLKEGKVETRYQFLGKLLLLRGNDASIREWLKSLGVGTRETDRIAHAAQELLEIRGVVFPERKALTNPSTERSPGDVGEGSTGKPTVQAPVV